MSDRPPLTERVAAAIGARPDWTSAELAEHLDPSLPLPYVTTALERLERRGLVRRVLGAKRRNPRTGAWCKVWRRSTLGAADAARVAREVPPKLREARARIDELETTCDLCGHRLTTQTGKRRHLTDWHKAQRRPPPSS